MLRLTAPPGERLETARRLDAYVAGAEVAVVSGITPALGPTSRRLVETFADDVAAAGARLCVDVNYRALLWGAESARQVLEPLLARADVVVCADRDAAIVFGVEIAD